jgi:hypothetical protein
MASVVLFPSNLKKKRKKKGINALRVSHRGRHRNCSNSEATLKKQYGARHCNRSWWP